MKKLVCSVFFLMILFNVEAQTSKGSIEVVGKATIKTIPEEVIFRIPLKIIDSSYLECSTAINKTLSNLRNELISKGIADSRIRTANFSISDHMVYEGGKRSQQGYQGSVTVIVSENYSVDFVQKVLQSVEKLELTYAINFSMSTDQKEELTKIAISQAVEDAKQKALVLSEASGVQLGEISRISYGKDSYRAEPLHTERMLSSTMDAVGSNELSLSPTRIALFKYVLIVWDIK